MMKRKPEMDAAQTLVGRLVRVAPEVGGGFIKSASGSLVYFEMSAVAGGANAMSGLRENARVHYRALGVGIPKAVWVSCG